MTSNPNFERLLIDTEVLTEDTLETARTEAAKEQVSVFRYLIDKGILSDEGLAKSLATFYRVEFMDGPLPIDDKLMALFPAFTLRHHNIVPLSRDSQKIKVATADPGNFLATDEISRLTGLTVTVICTTEKAVSNALNKTEQADGKKKTQADKAKGKDEKAKETVKVESRTVAESADKLLRRAINSSASDIHFEPMPTCAVVRERIDGVLYEVERMPLELFSPLVSRLKIMAGMDIVEKRLAQDGRFKFKVDNRDCEVRASTLPTIYGEKMVLRILRSGQVTPCLKMLDLGEEFDTIITKFCKLPDGLVLVAGPTGSGKTTTIYSILTEIDRKTKNLITIEDPVEYELDRANHVQVNSKIGVTFASILPTILRQDPDVILIGEMRDEKTAQLGTRAAITGHLVFSTIHAPDALQTVTRLVDMEVPSHMINAALKACISQRLLRQVCKKCKKPYESSPSDNKFLGLPENEPITLYNGVGCDACHHLGFSGRMVVMEILQISERIRKTISANDRANLHKVACEEGYKTMRYHATKKVIAGQTTIKELLAYIQ